MARFHAIAALLSWLLFTAINAATAAADAGPGAACNRTHLFCQLQDATINCDHSGAATFVQDFNQLNLVSLLDPFPGADRKKPSVLSVSSLHGLAACFLLTNDVNLQFVTGGAEFRLMPGALDAFAGVRQLSLILRFHQDRISAGLFTERLADLRNLQLDSFRVSDIEPGAFKDLRRLERLSISNLRLSHLAVAVLQGLGKLRILELRNNGLTKLDAASFSASPRLENLDLRRSSMAAIDVDPNTFCGFKMLRQLQGPASLGVNCSNFASRQLHLIVNRGPQITTSECERLMGQKSPCRAGTAGMAAVSTSTAERPVKTTAVKTVTTAAAATTGTTETAVRKTTTTAAVETKPTSTSKSIATILDTSSTTAPRLATLSAAAASATVASGGIIAVSLVAVVLILLAAAAGFAVFVATRRRLGGSISAAGGILRRAPSRQPIFSIDVGQDADIDMLDSLHWNPVFQGAAASTASTTEVAEAGASVR